MENMKKTLAIAILIFMSSCTNSQKQAIVEQGIPLVSFSAKNQLDQTDNSMSWIDKQGIVEYDTYFGWKCSKEGDKFFVWFAQKNIDETSNPINVSEKNCTK